MFQVCTVNGFVANHPQGRTTIHQLYSTTESSPSTFDPEYFTPPGEVARNDNSPNRITLTRFLSNAVKDNPEVSYRCDEYDYIISLYELQLDLFVICNFSFAIWKIYYWRYKWLAKPFPIWSIELVWSIAFKTKTRKMKIIVMAVFIR